MPLPCTLLHQCGTGKPSMLCNCREGFGNVLVLIVYALRQSQLPLLGGCSEEVMSFCRVAHLIKLKLCTKALLALGD